VLSYPYGGIPFFILELSCALVVVIDILEFLKHLSLSDKAAASFETNASFCRSSAI
jgi:hypothetical protein